MVSYYEKPHAHKKRKNIVLRLTTRYKPQVADIYILIGSYCIFIPGDQKSIRKRRKYSLGMERIEYPYNNHYLIFSNIGII